MQNGKLKYMVIYRNVLCVLSLWPPGKSLASQLIASLLWILKVCFVQHSSAIHSRVIFETLPVPKLGGCPVMPDNTAVHSLHNSLP